MAIYNPKDCPVSDPDGIVNVDIGLDIDLNFDLCLNLLLQLNLALNLGIEIDIPGLGLVSLDLLDFLPRAGTTPSCMNNSNLGTAVRPLPAYTTKNPNKHIVVTTELPSSEAPLNPLSSVKPTPPPTIPFTSIEPTPLPPFPPVIIATPIVTPIPPDSPCENPCNFLNF